MKLLALLLLALFLAACSDEVVSEINVTQLQETALQAQSALDTVKTELDTCLDAVKKKQDLRDDLVKSLGQDIADAKEETAKCEEKIQANLEAYEEKAANATSVITDAARRLCCARRLDDPTIDSYNVENNKIVCSHDGEKEISCN